MYLLVVTGCIFLIESTEKSRRMATDSSDCALSDTALSDPFHPHLTDPQSLLVLSRTHTGYLQFMLIAALKDFFFFFGCAAQLLGSQFPEQELNPSPGISAGKASACNAGDPCSIPGLGRSPGEGIGCPLQCSCLSSLSRESAKSQPPGPPGNSVAAFC